MIYILICCLLGIILAIKTELIKGIFIIVFIGIILLLIPKEKIIISIEYLKNLCIRKSRFINYGISENDEININNKMIIIYMFILISLFIYTNIKINLYDNKYETSDMSGDFIIISKEKSSEFYNKYHCKNSNGDKFILQVKKTCDITLEVRNKIKIEGKFELPKINRNYGGFNYRRYLNSQNIYGTIIVKDSKIELIEEGKIDFITNIKYKIEETFEKTLPQNHAGIINGILNGDIKNVSEDILADFKNSGITHLLAVSGSNVAYIIMFFSLTANKIIGKYLSYYISITTTIIFIFVSGASASVARAGIMAILNILAILISKKSNTINNICASAIILLLINPLIIYDVGFILSFVGTFGIVILSKRIINFIENFIKFKFVSETIGVTLAAQIMLLPIMAYYFNTISVISLITNFLVVPLTGFLTILGFITVILGIFSFKLAAIVSYAIYTLVSIIFKIASFCGDITWANILVPTPKIWMIICYYLIIFIFIKVKRNKKMILSTILIIVIFNFIIIKMPRNYINLNMIDVGQGDSFYIETQGSKTILIDGGGSESSDYDVGRNILLPYLLDKGKTTIDLVIISHPHEDHIEGIFTIIEELNVKNVIISENVDDNELIINLNEICKKRNTKITKVSDGDVFFLDDIQFDIIYPNSEIKDENVNNMSLIIKMKFGEITALFTGDLEEDAENNIKKDIKADILKVGHHGSKTSTSEAFLRKVSPKIALISVGCDNLYGHPDKIVLERLSKIGSRIYRTDESGEIELKIYKKYIKIKNEKYLYLNFYTVF